jgi:RNA polymerase sigma factor (sigma-70 family)
MILQDDKQVIHRVLAGNVRDYAILVDRYKDLAFTIAYRILNNREDAEEVAQDAFVKAYRNLASFRKDATFSTWLYRIVFNTAISKKRLKKHVFQPIDDTPSGKIEADVPKYDFDAREDKSLILERAMQKLPDEDRVLLTLHYINESDVEEIHRITGLSKSNVKIKLFRARKKLKDMISVTDEVYF